MDWASIFWFLVVVGGTALLGIAFVFGVAQWRRRDRRLDRAREQATRENYAAADREADQSSGKGDLSVGTTNVTRSNAA